MDKRQGWRVRFTQPPPTLQVLFGGTQVAELSKQKNLYVFRYLEMFKQLHLAPIPGFPDLERVYEAQELFPYFAERIPDRRRPEIRAWIDKSGISDDNDLQLLATLGARSITDPFELTAAVA